MEGIIEAKFLQGVSCSYNSFVKFLKAALLDLGAMATDGDGCTVP